jgi:hypothetical protein
VTAATTLLIVLLALSPVLILPFVLAWASATGRLDRWGWRFAAWRRRHERPLMVLSVLGCVVPGPLYVLLAVVMAMTGGSAWLVTLAAVLAVSFTVTGYDRLAALRRRAGGREPTAGAPAAGAPGRGGWSGT